MWEVESLVRLASKSWPLSRAGACATGATGPRYLGLEIRLGVLSERSQFFADAFRHPGPDLHVALLLYLYGEFPVEALGFLEEELDLLAGRLFEPHRPWQVAT